jgi:hypothetical protein
MRDPRRPLYLVDKQNQVVSFGRSLHQDVEKDETSRSKNVAKQFFQAMATAYVRVDFLLCMASRDAPLLNTIKSSA